MVKCRQLSLLSALVSVFVFLCPATQAENSEVFNPDGYYFPKVKILVDGYVLEFFELETLDYYYDGALHYERPRLKTPEARVRLIKGKGGKFSDFRFTESVITRERLFLRSEATPIGIITIEGGFLDKQGHFWERPEIKRFETSVAQAVVTVVKAGKSVYTRQHDFTFWEGD